MRFTELVEQLKSTTSKNEKLIILDGIDSDFIEILLRETFDPNLLHNVRISKSDLPEPGFCDLELLEEGFQITQLLEDISMSKSSKQNKEAVLKIMRILKREDQEALLGVVNKSLKVGINIKLINTALPGLIEVVPIQLANKYNPKKKYPTDHWLWSYKLDGMRVFAYYYGDHWFIYSRAKEYLGRRIDTLDHWKPELMKLYNKYGITYLEGEAYLHGWKFERIQGAVMSDVNKKVDAKSLQFHVFLVGSCMGVNPKNLTDIKVPRRQVLPGGNNIIQTVYQGEVNNNKKDIYEILEAAVLEGYEGVMLRDPNNLLTPKRSNYLLKVKKSDVSGTVVQADCFVDEVIFDHMTVMQNGEVTTEYLPTKLRVTQADGIECLVGSGFALDFRRELKANPFMLLNKIIEVEFQGYGANGRMRFPVYKRVREDL
jgi:ATP-dependent DNA ligase